MSAGVPDWRSKGACVSESPELFFPIGTTGPALTQLGHAKLVCGACAVRERCLQWATDNSVEHGVWGGLSEEERRSFKRRAGRNRLNRNSATL